MLMYKDKSVSQHVLKFTVLIPSWFPANRNARTFYLHTELSIDAQ